MGLDSSTGVRWVVQTLLGDSTLQMLLGGPRVYRDEIPRGEDLTLKPAIFIAHQSSDKPERPMKRGNQTQVYTRLDVQTTATIQQASYVKLEEVIERVLALLDGQVYAVVSDGTVYECVKGIDLQRSENKDGVPRRYIDVFWSLRAKAD